MFYSKFEIVDESLFHRGKKKEQDSDTWKAELILHYVFCAVLIIQMEKNRMKLCVIHMKEESKTKSR